jgi:hypothetical protein
MNDEQIAKFANLLLSFAITIEAWADQMRHESRTEQAWWEAIELLRRGGGTLRGAANQLDQLL